MKILNDSSCASATGLHGRQPECSASEAQRFSDTDDQRAWTESNRQPSASKSVGRKSRRRRPREPKPDTFWSFVQIRGGDECWLWRPDEALSSPRPIYRKQIAARVALERCGMPVPAGLLACHRCDNPQCVNPGHLYAGTHRDNAMDAVRAGIAPPQARNGAAGVEDSSMGLCDRFALHPAVRLTTCSVCGGVGALCASCGGTGVAGNRRWRDLDHGFGSLSAEMFTGQRKRESI